jgi:phosphoserine phosphatase RsbU/P
MKIVIKGSLGRRVLGISFLLFALPLLIYFFFVFRFNYETKLHDTVVHFENLGKNRAIMLSDLTQYNFRTLDLIESMIDLEQSSKDASDDDVNGILYQLALRGHFDLISYYTITEDGYFICTLSSDKTKIGKDYTDYHYVQNAVIYDRISFLAFSKRFQRKRFYVTKAIYSAKTGDCIGILTMGMSVNELLKGMTTINEAASYPIHFSILTEDKIVFDSSDKGLSLRPLYALSDNQLRRIEATQQFVDIPLRENNIDIRNMKGPHNVHELRQEDKLSLSIFLPVSGTNLMILTHAKMDDVFAREHHLLISVLVTFVSVFIGGAALTLWMTWLMSKPLESLCNAMGRVSEGDLQARYIEDKMGFEINSIGTIFNETISNLISHMEEAENERVQKETLAHELRIGYDIQTTILPRTMPDFTGIELAARYSPAKEVGGDFFDIFVKKEKHGNDKLVMTVADAAGKGISACLYSLCLRSMLRSYYVAHENIANMMTRANHLFCLDTGNTGMFVTVLTTIFNPQTKQLSYCSCGHNPGYVCHQDGTIEELSASGIAMGVMEYEEDPAGGSIQLQSGDIVLLYTDGVTEAHNINKELFGEKRLKRVLREQTDGSVDEMLDRVLKRIKEFVGEAPQHDDITTVFMKIL